MTLPSTVRLDAALVARGLARSRGHARDLIRQGVVRVAGDVAVKASRGIRPGETLEVEQSTGTLGPQWVSRAAGKLLGAFAELPGGGPPVAGVRAADVGACTGGFTQVLLDRGAREVVAIDVGHDQLAPTLREDPRVVDLPGRNIRDLGPADIGGEVDLLVCDLSFISLTLVMPRLVSLVRAGGDLLVLVKPQFEVGREGLDGRGVVRPGPWRGDAVLRVLSRATEAGLAVQGIVPSRTRGQEGNLELVAWLHRPAGSPVGLAWQAVCETIDDIVSTATSEGHRT